MRLGSVDSRYHKIVKLLPQQSQSVTRMSGYPPHFNQLKIWLPKCIPISTEIEVGQTQRFNLTKGNQPAGETTTNTAGQETVGEETTGQ
jgi:hypothetical protein